MEHFDGRIEKAGVGEVVFNASEFFGVYQLNIEAEILVNVEGVALTVWKKVNRIASTPWGLWWMVRESPEKRIAEREWR